MKMSRDLSLAKLFDLSDKVAIVTGSGSGLGARIAQGLAQYGAKVIICGRTVSEIERVRDEIIAFGGIAEAVPYDATQHQQSTALVDDTIARFGRLDIAVINHGIGHGRAAEDLSVEDWDTVMGINLRGCFSAAQAAGRQMLQQGDGGSIVVIGSTGGVVAFPNLLAYATSKAGAIQLAKQLAVEWGDRGIRVNAVCPGYMTHMMKGTSDRYSGEEVDEWVNRQTPMRRWGDPEEVVGAVIYFASPASTFVTGQVLSVDGGYTSL
jgi:NAD(P)-dependent dehydrogenase (short-subunit alcohol dehydrogenase family)